MELVKRRLIQAEEIEKERKRGKKEGVYNRKLERVRRYHIMLYDPNTKTGYLQIVNKENVKITKKQLEGRCSIRSATRQTAERPLRQ